MTPPSSTPIRRTGVRGDKSGVSNDGFSAGPIVKAHVGVVVINYKTPDLIKQCLTAMGPQLERSDARVVVVDNHSADGSAEEIARFLSDAYGEGAGWKLRVSLVRSRENTGFSGGNNLGLGFLDADFYLLVNSDTMLKPGAISALLGSAKAHPQAGVIGPRLEDGDGVVSASAFRAISPATVFMEAAQLSVLDALLPFFIVAKPLSDRPMRADWVSFACVLLRRETVDAVGPMDAGYFMYFEDADYCRAARKAGFEVLYDPAAHVVHLRGGSSSVKSEMAAKKRPPAYYYAARTRYFRKTFGPAGPLLANIAWRAGRVLAHIRLIAGRKPPAICENEARDNWLNWRDPLGDGHAPADASPSSRRS
ncbi:MAG: glycosyltransferase family 2 protein [Pseudomonadota bacterium]